MAHAINDMIVVCRPEQVREAAIVLSCCPADRFTPLIVVEPSPLAEHEYRRRYDVYVEARNRRDAFTGGPLARSTTAIDTPQVVSALNKAVDDAAGALTPYRSWWRHQRLVSALLSDQPLRRAIFLFEADPRENRLINALPISRIGDQREPTIPETIEWVSIVPLISQHGATNGSTRHTYASLVELADIAWRVCGHVEGWPEDAIDVHEADEGAYFNALWRALARGVPLRPTSAPRRDGDPSYATAAKEAVLIELTRDADNLLGVQYAHHRNAKLIVYPQPDTRAQQDLKAAIGAPQNVLLGEWAGRAVEEPAEAPDKLLGNLREYLFGDPALSERIRRIERAVSAMVPDDIIDAVGDRDLTVFTSGIPYTFVKKNGVDWSSKAVGHVAGDAALLVLTELCWSPQKADVGFSLLFDPGFFQAETKDVLAVLQKQASYPLVLRGAAGSSLALLHLGPVMPLDVLFFNTHGSDQAILLSDGPLPAFKLLQRQTLMSRPFVFNNSCLSWVGVGREFVRVGARGYVGTLWSVDAEVARNYARTVLDRITQGETVSRALRGTGLAASTERAYIYIGTCGTRVENPGPKPDGEQQRVAQAAEMLFNVTARLLEQTGDSELPFFSALEDLLSTKAKELVADYDHRWPESLERLDVALSQLRVMSHVVGRRSEAGSDALERIDDARRMIDTLTLTDKERADATAQLTQYSGRIHLRLGLT